MSNTGRLAESILGFSFVPPVATKRRLGPGLALQTPLVAIMARTPVFEQTPSVNVEVGPLLRIHPLGFPPLRFVLEKFSNTMRFSESTQLSRAAPAAAVFI